MDTIKNIFSVIAGLFVILFIIGVGLFFAALSWIVVPAIIGFFVFIIIVMSIREWLGLDNH